MLCDILTVKSVKRARSIRGSAYVHIKTINILQNVYKATHSVLVNKFNAVLCKLCITKNVKVTAIHTFAHLLVILIQKVSERFEFMTIDRLHHTLVLT